MDIPGNVIVTSWGQAILTRSVITKYNVYTREMNCIKDYSVT